MDEKFQLAIDEFDDTQTQPTFEAPIPATDNTGATAGAALSELCYVILDALNAEDNLVPALSEQSKASELRNSRYVYVYDGRIRYFGQIEKGPIYTPEWGAVGDGPNTYPIVSGDKVEYVPSYYGYVQVRILGEIEVIGEKKLLQKTFHRPHPKAKISYVPENELLGLLKLPNTEHLMGVMANYSNKEPDRAVKFAIEDKLIRKQLGIFGATGQGKSNTVLALAETLSASGWCVIILDHSGEYTECHEASEESQLFTPFWLGLGVKPEGVKNLTRLLPVCDPTNPKGAIKFSVMSKSVSFSILKSFLNLSPTQDEKLDMIKRELGDNYDGLRSLLSSVNNLPEKDVSKAPLERKLQRLIDKGAYNSTGGGRLFDNEQTAKEDLSHPDLYGKQSKTSAALSQQVSYLSEQELIKPNSVTVIDFGNISDQDILNIVALDVLKKLERAKASVRRANRTKVAIFMEEAHTFFSAEYTGNEKIAASLTSTVKKIFKIGRKFYLNPVVISQQPSDVPGSILSQCSTKIIHQLSDEDDIRKVTKGSAKRYQNTIPDLRTGEALVTNSEFTTAQIIRLRPAKAKKIDPFLVKADTEIDANAISEEADYTPEED
jgi:DNA helicase HerA-like ATPase